MQLRSGGLRATCRRILVAWRYSDSHGDSDDSLGLQLASLSASLVQVGYVSYGGVLIYRLPITLFRVLISCKLSLAESLDCHLWADAVAASAQNDGIRRHASTNEHAHLPKLPELTLCDDQNHAMSSCQPQK